jgi:hypothetical protein
VNVRFGAPLDVKNFLREQALNSKTACGGIDRPHEQ